MLEKLSNSQKTNTFEIIREIILINILLIADRVLYKF
jgi:hypothetical protein